MEVIWKQVYRGVLNVFFQCDKKYEFIFSAIYSGYAVFRHID